MITSHLVDFAVSAAGSFFGGMGVVIVTLGPRGFRSVRAKFGRPRLQSLLKQCPADLLFAVEIGAPASRVQEMLGSPSRASSKSWAYRYLDALVTIDFYDDSSVQTVALALTVNRGTFQVPMFEDIPPLGNLTLGDVLASTGGTVERRDSLRHEELFTHTRVGPTGAWTNFTFGALWPLAPGRLAPTEFSWNRAQDVLETPPNLVPVNWVALSASHEPAWFPWDLGLGGLVPTRQRQHPVARIRAFAYGWLRRCRSRFLHSSRVDRKSDN